MKSDEKIVDKTKDERQGEKMFKLHLSNLI